MEIRFPLILDGATGTELQKRGYGGDVSAEQWTLEHPDVIVDIQRGYVAAGSQVLYTPTFGANRQKLEERSIFNQTADYNRRLAALSREAAGGRAWIAGDLAPTGLFLAPLGEASFEDLVDIYTEQAAGLEAAGVDLYVIETMMTLSDARAAVLAVRSVSDKPIFVSFTCDESGRSLSGTDVTAALTVLQGMGISAFGLNCSTGPEQMLVQLRRLREYARVPLIAKPNAGMPITVGGKTVYDCTPEEFTAFVQPMLAAGVAVFGGCCGTNPDYIRALHGAVHTMMPGARDIHHGSFLCTPTMPLEISGVRVIGERINPTGKKSFQQALLAGNLDYIVDVAIAQVDAGAQILDVNVGYPGVDEVAMLPRVVKKLQEAVDVPLQLDSTNAAALEAALRVYNGKAAVNSVNGEEKALQTLLPVVKKYGAAVVGLALDEKGLPKTAAERVAIARRIVDAAERFGIPREDVFIDCLTLTVSAQQDQADAIQ